MPFAIARVIVDRSADREFDYAIPPLLASVVQIGSRVRLPFAGRTAALGTVVDLVAESAAVPAKLRPLTAVIGDGPIISPILLGLGRWMADYYCCPVETAMRSVLPQVIRAAEVEHKTQLFARLLRRPDETQAAKLSRQAPRQAEVLAALAASGDKPLPAAELGRQCGATHQTLQALARSGWISLAPGTVERDPYDDEIFLAGARETLTGEQEIALAKVRAALDAPAAEKKPVLLHGVTGSGKTEVYLQAISLALDRGQTALVLVPEISLTPQTVERFKSRFAAMQDRVAVLHSHLSAGERHDEWHKVHSGHARIVIGARSAVFAPLAGLGLIVVDEEHETSYKQEEAPHYQARDVAVLRASWRVARWSWAAPRRRLKAIITPSSASTTWPP